MDTLFLPTSPAYSFVSSSLVKQVASYGGDVRHLLPDVVAAALAGKINARPDADRGTARRRGPAPRPVVILRTGLRRACWRAMPDPALARLGSGRLLVRFARLAGRKLGELTVGGSTMYRVFEALDELVTIVEEARGVP